MTKADNTIGGIEAISRHIIVFLLRIAFFEDSSGNRKLKYLIITVDVFGKQEFRLLPRVFAIKGNIDSVSRAGNRTIAVENIELTL